MRKKILLTNDDGYFAPGIKAVFEVLSEDYNVTIVAPAHERSACAHSLSLSRSLVLEQRDFNIYSLNDGTPTDCVYLALNGFLKNESFDLVVSGANMGANMGEDITYSGTCGACMEAVLQGVGAIALSQVFFDDCSAFDFELTRHIAKTVVAHYFNQPPILNRREFLSFNIPPLSLQEFKGYQTAYAGCRIVGSVVENFINDRGQNHWFIGGCPLKAQGRVGKQGLSDFEAVKKGFVSVTPIMMDLTAYDQMQNTQNWLEGLQ